jgi:hypothetical protein
MACTVESVVTKLPQAPGMEFKWKIRSMVDKSKSSRPDINKKQSKGWMDGWVDEWMDGWMDGCMDG